MASFNRVILLGNLTRDPELRYNGNQKAVATFSIAINSKVRDGQGGFKEKVDYFDVIVWDKAAESAEKYLKKGAPVLIEGRLRQLRWVTDDGQNRSKVEVAATDVRFMPKRESGGVSEDEAPPVDEGDMPF